MALANRLVTYHVRPQPKVSVSQAQKPSLNFVDTHFQLLTFANLSDSTSYKRQVALVPFPSGPRANSLPMPQGYTGTLGLLSAPPLQR